MIYVAASSTEIERAEKWSAKLRGEGIGVTSVWPETIRRVQAERAMKTTNEASNPAQATVADRRKWSLENVAQIKASEMFWLLVPAAENPSQGAYFEFAVARENHKLTFASGGDQRFVFTALAQIICEDDDSAFDMIRHIYRRRAAL